MILQFIKRLFDIPYLRPPVNISMDWAIRFVPLEGLIIFDVLSQNYIITKKQMSLTGIVKCFLYPLIGTVFGVLVWNDSHDLKRVYLALLILLFPFLFKTTSFGTTQQIV